MDLPEVVLSEIFKYLKRADFIDASTVCKTWRNVIWSGDFSEKVKKTNHLFNDKQRFIKTYQKKKKKLIGFNLKFTEIVFLFYQNQELV